MYKITAPSIRSFFTKERFAQGGIKCSKNRDDNGENEKDTKKFQLAWSSPSKFTKQPNNECHNDDENPEIRVKQEHYSCKNDFQNNESNENWQNNSKENARRKYSEKDEKNGNDKSDKNHST